MKRLRERVRKTIARARLPATSGSTRRSSARAAPIRNLAKVNRRTHLYPISRLHGYRISLNGLQSLATRLAARARGARAAVPGLNSDRVDSIVGGVVCIETAMEAVGADSLLVSGQGMREGVALALTEPRLVSIEEVRERSRHALLSRFSTWDEARAERRAALVVRLGKRLDPRNAAAIRAPLELAARALDIGRAVDYYNRHRHASMILTATDLNGYAQREVALAAAIVSLAGDEDGLLEAFRPLLQGEDEISVLRASVVLALAEEMENRSPRGRPIAFSCRSAARPVPLGGVGGLAAAHAHRSVPSRFRA